MARILDIHADLLRNIYAAIGTYFPEFLDDPVFLGKRDSRGPVEFGILGLIEYASYNHNAENAKKALTSALYEISKTYSAGDLVDAMIRVNTPKYECISLAILHTIKSIDFLVQAGNRVKSSHHHNQATLYLDELRMISKDKSHQYSPPKEKSEVMRQVEREMFWLRDEAVPW